MQSRDTYGLTGTAPQYASFEDIQRQAEAVSMLGDAENNPTAAAAGKKKKKKKGKPGVAKKQGGTVGCKPFGGRFSTDNGLTMEQQWKLAGSGRSAEKR